MIDLLTPKMKKRMYELVDGYAKKGNRRGIVRLIGGEPQQDLFDYIPGYDDGEPPHGAQW